MDTGAVVIINPILTLGSLGFIFGLGLAYASVKFGIEVDPRVHEVEETLPKGQCGACGFAGCSAYAEAVVTNPDVQPNLCIPGRAEVAKLIAHITGKEAKEIAGLKAYVACQGIVDRTYIYDGLMDCEAGNLLFGGDKICQYACLGMGSCIKVCKFNAIKMGDLGLPVINPDSCTGCGQCILVCPKGIIELISEGAKVKVLCRSYDKGAMVKKICKLGCIGCGICAKECSTGAIEIKNFLAIIDHSKCIDCLDYKCLSKCPTHAIVAVSI